MKKYILFAFIVILLGSCTNRMTDFTVISTKNVPLGDDDVELVKGNMRVSGTDVGHVVLSFPVSFPNMKEAIDKAIQSVPDCVGLVDGVVKNNFWWAFLYGQSKYIVEGTPLLSKKKDVKIDLNIPTPQVQTVVVPKDDSQAGLIFTHDVKSNETLATIAKMYNVNVSDIIRWNGLTSSTIKAGQSLKVIVK